MDPRDLGFICICAVRYALGRQSYGPGIVISFVTANRYEIAAESLRVIARDIREETARGAIAYEREWIELAELLEAMP